MHLPYRAGMWLESAPLCLFREPFLVCGFFQEACLEACGSHVRSQFAEPSSLLGITPLHLSFRVGLTVLCRRGGMQGRCIQGLKFAVNSSGREESDMSEEFAATFSG